ncbi:MAG: hypothetical protein CL908_09850 [Deltaproteobacteria bacterium]|nr:hypothetical protein [Deltaproteobacteria bacterium]
MSNARSPTRSAPPHPFPLPFDAVAFEGRLRALADRDPFLIPRDVIPPHFNRSSVLICFWRDAADLRVLFTKRAESLRGHPGQMSFPGGRLEKGESRVEAALRESEEEVGLSATRVEVLGRLDDAWSGAGHLLVPVVGWLDDVPDLTPNPAEVAEIHTPGIAGLFDPAVFEREERTFAGDVYYNSILRWEGGHVFGLSTDLLIEVIQWGIGLEDHHGPGRARSLTSHLRHKAEEANTDRGGG